MNGFDWLKRETFSCIGTQALQNQINACSQKYTVTTVLSNIKPELAKPTDKYVVEVWYNVDSRCTILNIFEIIE